MTGEKTRILVVEDDDMNRKLFGSLLREKGYDVVEATDGEEAIELIRGKAPSMVLMDISLPKINGSDVLRICREKGLLDNTKVYALTGSVSKDIDEAGFDGIITKPIRVSEFLNTVKTSLEVNKR